MTVQDSVLQILASAVPDGVSGEEIAVELGVSRASVWKAIQKLQEQGYTIEGVRSKGYTLRGECDPVTESGVSSLLSPEAAQVVSLCVKSSTGSTNTDVKELAEQGAEPFACVVAGEQKSGRGRRGRSFFSLGDTGVYLSLLIKPQIPIGQAGLITGAAAVSVCKAIESITGLEPRIKWVNDVYVGDKKVCGILTEGSADLESGNLASAIVGIGVNVYEPPLGFPEEIAQRAGALYGGKVQNARNAIAAAIINGCVEAYCGDALSSSVEEYRRYSMMPGRRIAVIEGDGSEYEATAIGINDDLSLQITLADGTESSVSSGEVSVRI